MNIVQIIVVLSAVVSVLLLWGVIVYRHLKRLETELAAQWELVRDSLEKRHSLIPNLIETFRQFGAFDDPQYEEIITKRAAVVKDYYPSDKKSDNERALSKKLNGMLNLAAKQAGLKMDTNFLELRKEIDDLEKNLDERVEKYQTMAEVYNQRLTLWAVRLFTGIFGFKKAKTFSL